MVSSSRRFLSDFPSRLPVSWSFTSTRYVSMMCLLAVGQIISNFAAAKMSDYGFHVDWQSELKCSEWWTSLIVRLAGGDVWALALVSSGFQRLSFSEWLSELLAPMLKPLKVRLAGRILNLSVNAQHAPLFYCHYKSETLTVTVSVIIFSRFTGFSFPSFRSFGSFFPTRFHFK